MPRKIGSKSAAECRTPSARDKRLVKSIYVGASNAIRWNCLKKRLCLGSDVELVHHLLDLADSSQEKRQVHVVEDYYFKYAEPGSFKF
jgi:hypothetical protein